MAERLEHQPGSHAPVPGHSEELNIFGTQTGRVEHVREGERLPHGRAVSRGGRSRKAASTLSRSYCRVQALQLDACIGRSELPVCLGVVLVAVVLPGGDFLDEHLLVGDPSIEALA